MREEEGGGSVADIMFFREGWRMWGLYSLGWITPRMVLVDLGVVRFLTLGSIIQILG